MAGALRTLVEAHTQRCRRAVYCYMTVQQASHAVLCLVAAHMSTLLHTYLATIKVTLKSLRIGALLRANLFVADQSLSQIIQ